MQIQEPLFKIVTRTSKPEELDRFQHSRMPSLEKPSFVLLPPEVDDAVESDVFG